MSVSLPLLLGLSNYSHENFYDVCWCAFVLIDHVLSCASLAKIDADACASHASWPFCICCAMSTCYYNVRGHVWIYPQIHRLLSSLSHPFVCHVDAFTTAFHLFIFIHSFPFPSLYSILCSLQPHPLSWCSWPPFDNCHCLLLYSVFLSSLICSFFLLCVLPSAPFCRVAFCYASIVMFDYRHYWRTQQGHASASWSFFCSSSKVW